MVQLVICFPCILIGQFQGNLMAFNVLLKLVFIYYKYIFKVAIALDILVKVVACEKFFISLMHLLFPLHFPKFGKKY